MSADARFDADGWQYGVRFVDGSVRACWNGSTQRERAEQDLARLRAWLPNDGALLRIVRRQRDGEWIDVSER